MSAFILDERLANDCFVLAENNLNLVLLMNNAAIPWLILVPRVSVIEWVDLEAQDERQLKQDIDCLSAFLRSHYAVDKLNIAGIGNVVSQLHIHVIGRNEADYYWPNVVWGTQAPATYDLDSVTEIQQQLLSFAPGQFRRVNNES
jgi:diadenosine tetraphosphate (Ap4A) HIT family hydrolase